MIKGKVLSDGIGIGKVKIIKKEEEQIEYILPEKVDEEIEIFEKAKKETEKQLISIKEKTSQEIGKDEAKIFDAHILILKDPNFISSVKKNIKEKNLTAKSAIREAIKEISILFQEIDDKYIKERIQDVKDVGKKIIENIEGKKESISGEIILAEEISPSLLVQLKEIKGVICKRGTDTSHSAIIARSKGIPMIQISDFEGIKEGDFIIIDGEGKKIILNPENDLVKYYENLEIQKKREKEELFKFKDLPAQTRDGRIFKVLANISHPEEVEIALKYGAEGVGLFRTEFLYVDRKAPISEEEQFKIYTEVAKKFKDMPVVIRTFDLGGDKNIPYLELPSEENPFLGIRGIRFAFKFIEIFKTQLKAILKASGISPNIQILLPMISTFEEIKKAKEIIKEVKGKMKEENIPYNEEIKLGIMIEVPSSAIISDILAEEVDFFSIGTNDLIQYLLAVDRNNEKVNYLYNYFDISVLRVIKEIIKNAKSKGIKVSMCGEMASDINAIPNLIEYGLDEFSVDPNWILKVKKRIREI
jgi:phosphotransferase system enzyme I (PtsI)